MNTDLICDWVCHDWLSTLDMMGMDIHFLWCLWSMHEISCGATPRNGIATICETMEQRESVAFGRQLGRVEQCASQCCNDQSHVFFDQSHVFFDIFPIHLDHLLVVLGKAGHLFDSRYREKKIEC
jgi:hypothetical protein